VIDITTRHALGCPSAEAQVAYGSYGTTDYALNYAQEIGKLSLFMAGDFQNTKRGFDPPSVTPILHDDMRSGNAFVRLDYRLRETDHIEFITTFNQSRFQIPIDPTLLPLSEAPPGAVRGADAYGNDPPPFVPYDANPVENERNVFAAISYKHAGAGGTLQIAPFFREAYGKLTCDPAGSLGPTADPGSACSDVRRDVLHGGGLAQFTWAQGQQHIWKTGLLLDAARSNVDYTAYFRDDAASLGGADPARTLPGSDITNVLIAGAFLQDQILLGKLKILAGARLDIESASFLHSDEPSLFLLGPSARLGLSYAVTTNLTLHGFAGYLWQPPSTIDAPVAGRILVPSLAGQTLPVDLKAERDWSAELGLTDRLLPGLTLDITGWGRIASDQLDRVNVGTTNLVASYNFERGRAAGAEASCRLSGGDNVDGFANLGWQLAQGSGISSERFLFSPEEVADKHWVMLDHVQTWTANLGIDLHDALASTHVSALLNYGSGMRTGADSDKTVPSHVIVDLTIRHRFGIFSDISSHLHPEIAVDVLNLFDQVYAYRIGTGYVGSAYGPPRRVFVRLSVPFS
jgi:outer membrane receptor protein involved in Fe transport